MSDQPLTFGDEQNRVIVNLHQHYDVWMEASKRLEAMPYGMKWKTVAGRDYLHETRDRQGNGTSLGVRSEATEQLMHAFSETKEAMRRR